MARKTKSLTIKVTEEEYKLLTSIQEEAKAFSLSDLIRHAFMRMAENYPSLQRERENAKHSRYFHSPRDFRRYDEENS